MWHDPTHEKLDALDHFIEHLHYKNLKHGKINKWVKLTRIPVSAYNHNQRLLLHPLSFDCTWNQMQGKPAHICLCNEAAIKVKKDVIIKYDMKNTHLFRYFLYITKCNHSSGCNLGSRNLHIYEIQLHQIQIKIFYFPNLIYIYNYQCLC